MYVCASGAHREGFQESEMSSFIKFLTKFYKQFNPHNNMRKQL